MQESAEFWKSGFPSGKWKHFCRSKSEKYHSNWLSPEMSKKYFLFDKTVDITTAGKRKENQSIDEKELYYINDHTP